MTVRDGFVFAEPDEAEISEIRLAVRVTVRQFGQPGEVIAKSKSRFHQTVLNHRDDERHVLQMECGLRHTASHVNSARSTREATSTAQL